jgi:hypothetical protein
MDLVHGYSTIDVGLYTPDGSYHGKAQLQSKTQKKKAGWQERKSE